MTDRQLPSSIRRAMGVESAEQLPMAQPWLDEPNFDRFEHATFPCVIIRNPSLLNLCGYVGVPPIHPLYGKDYADRIVLDREQLEKLEIREENILDLFYEAIHEHAHGEDGRISITLLLQPHGGVTFAGDCLPGVSDRNVWWFGFDCAHACDLTPAFIKHGLTMGTYRDIEYVRQECRKMAKRLAWFQRI